MLKRELFAINATLTVVFSMISLQQNVMPIKIVYIRDRTGIFQPRCIFIAVKKQREKHRIRAQY